MKINFISLSSGSNGNCYYLGTEKYGILIDAGISPRTIRKRLNEVGIDFESIHAVFVTHDHTDHIKGVGTIGQKFNIPIYSTKLIHSGIASNHNITEKLSPINIRYIEKNTPIKLEDFHIIAFDVPHDATDNVGYCIEINEKKFVFMTDLGEIPNSVISYIENSNYLIIESNYDEKMLIHGSYPSYLKSRISCNKGHMCNKDTGIALAQHYSPNLQYIWLCHLSKDNNNPELAYQTVKDELKQCGIQVERDVQLVALKRTSRSELYTFE